MILKEILKNTSVQQFIGNELTEITDITQDSRKIERGALFIAVKGANSDGHSFINKAIQEGASAILCENLPDERPEHYFLLIKVENTTEIMPLIASNFYQIIKRAKIGRSYRHKWEDNNINIVI